MSALEEALGAALLPLAPYLALVIFAFLPSEVWRFLGVFLARGIDERSEVLVFVRAVATTLLAAVVAKLLLTPTGALALVPLAGRIGAVLAGLLAFFALRRSVIAAIVVAEFFLIAVALSVF